MLCIPAVLRHEADAGADRIRRSACGEWLAVDQDLTAGMRAQAEHRLECLRAAGADQPA
jgi:hypothetical protein